MDKKYYFWYLGITIGLFLANILIRMNGYRSPILIILEYISYGAGVIYLTSRLTVFCIPSFIKFFKILFPKKESPLDEISKISLIGIGLTYILVLIFKKMNPFMYPGVENKVMYLLLISGIFFVTIKLFKYFDKIVEAMIEEKETIKNQGKRVNKGIKKSSHKIDGFFELCRKYFSIFLIKTEKILIVMWKKSKRILLKIYRSNAIQNKKIRATWGSYLALFIIVIMKNSFLSMITVEWISLIFIGMALLFFYLRIDSRYLILPAIVLLWYCPFLLAFKKDKIAEEVAIYVYYFLVVGVVLQIVETYKKKYKVEFNFEKITTVLYSDIMKDFGSYLLIVAIIIFFVKNVSGFLKATTLFLSTTALAAYYSKYIIVSSSSNHRTDKKSSLKK